MEHERADGEPSTGAHRFRTIGRFVLATFERALARSAGYVSPIGTLPRERDEVERRG